MRQNGFTLLETMIYIALIMFMMGSALVAAFSLVDASAKDRGKILSAVEAEFLMRKINWVLSDLDQVTPVNSAGIGYLSVNKNGFPNPFIMDIPAHRARLSENGSPSLDITADRVTIANLNFLHIAAVPPKPAAIVTTFTIDGKNYTMTKYIR